MSDPRLSLVDDEVRAALEVQAPGALEAGGERAGRALDLLACNVLRALAMDMVQRANSGHPGGPCSSMDFAYLLHRRHLVYSRDPGWRDRDRFILSGGHMSTLLYGILHLQGRLEMQDLLDFRQLGSRTQGHPVAGFAPGIETTTGPLGQGFANGVGMALAEQLARQTFGEDMVRHHTWVLATDGDLQEGVCREAAQLAGHWGLGRLNVFFDSNDVQLASVTAKCWSEDVGASFQAMGWHVAEVDGHDHGALDAAMVDALAETGRPSLIVGKTRIAHGTTLEGQVKTHGSPLGAECIAAYKASHGHPARDFWIPEAVAASCRERLDAGDAAQKAWQGRVEAALALGGPRAERWRTFHRDQGGEDMLARAREAVRALRFEGNAATRSAAGKAQAALAPVVPGLVGGSADLANSTKTDLFEKTVGYLGDGAVGDEPAPRALHFGVREHAMASICNGLALHGGWLPFAGTFLVFSDYLRGAIRLGAISELPVTYVLTHDSVFLGEDGETHQPVEHTESLRLIPGVDVLRPADAYEAAEAWLYALERHLGDSPAPVALVLSRQDLPVLDGGSERARGLHQGGYLLRGDPTQLPDIELLASGSEVALALEAAALLEGDGTRVRVISVPCREAFARLAPEARDAVLHPDCPFKLVLEAGRVSGWSELAGYPVQRVSIDRYGESAPLPELAETYGYTGAQVAERVRGILAGRRQALARDLGRRAAYLRDRLPAVAGEVLEGL